MRALVLPILVLAALPLAAATPPTEPWVFEGSSVEGSGAVGEPIVVTVRVKANTDLDTTILFRAPDHVLVDGGPWHATAAAGETVEHTWTVTPTQEGFWAAIAHADPATGVNTACACALGFASGAPEAIVGSTVEKAVPVPLLDRALTASEQEGGTVRLERAIVPVSSWLAHAEIHAWATPGSTYFCDSCAVRVPEAQHEVRAPGNDTVLLSTTLPLAEGEAFTLWDEVLVTFATPEGSPVGQRTSVPTGCENRRWGTEETWSCETASKEWSHMTGPREKLENAIPMGGALAVAALAAMSLAYRPPRGNRR